MKNMTKAKEGMVWELVSLLAWIDEEVGVLESCQVELLNQDELPDDVVAGKLTSLFEVRREVEERIKKIEKG